MLGFVECLEGEDMIADSDFAWFYMEEVMEEVSRAVGAERIRLGWI